MNSLGCVTAIYSLIHQRTNMEHSDKISGVTEKVMILGTLQTDAAAAGRCGTYTARGRTNKKKRRRAMGFSHIQFGLGTH